MINGTPLTIRRVGAALFLCSVAATPSNAVVGPSTDGAAAAPYTVMILNRTGRAAGFCSGVVLARRAILTAAHCVPPGGDIRVHFRDEAGKPVLLPVEAVTRNPGYRADAVRTRQRSIDLALIRLPDDLPERFRPADLGALDGAPVGTPFRVAGFGVGREGDGATSGQLRMGAVETRAPVSAVLLWARDPAGQGTGACEGDSGGPVLAASADTVEAITLWSAGDGARRCGALTQALWLGPLRGWIAGVLSGWGL